MTPDTDTPREDGPPRATASEGETSPAPDRSAPARGGLFPLEDLPSRDDSAPASIPLETVLENAADAIVVTDAIGRIVFWNAAATREWEWTGDEVVGEPLARSIFADQEHHEEIRRALSEAGQWHGRIATVTKNGRVSVLHASISACGAKCGEQDRVLMSCRPGQLQDLAPDAAQRLERLEAFARSIDAAAHELNNAISPFSMSLGLLRARLDKPADVPLLELLEAATDQAATVVGELLKSSREAAGRGEAE